jgi:predicted short-subunit dehydrogenase-like oxidoreductase (DUF2520 family)
LAPLGRGDDLTDAALGVDVVVIATPDGAMADVAAAIRPVDGVAVVHVAGSLGLDVLAPHERRASVHPIAALPNPVIGAQRLVGAWFAVDGDPVAREIVAALDGRALDVGGDKRALHHAATVIASNHLVALLGQVERVAADVGVPLEAYLDLVRATVENVAGLGPAAALTGPVARGDWGTVARHLDALPADERAGYEAMVELARRLVEERVACK